MADNEAAGSNSKTFKPYKKQKLADYKRSIRLQGQGVYDFSKFKSREKRPFISPTSGSGSASSSTSASTSSNIGFVSTDMPGPSHQQSLHISEETSTNSQCPSSVSSHLHISSMEQYFNLLVNRNGVTIGNALGTVLVINDINEDTGMLQSDKFIVIERKVVKFLIDDAYHWISWCHCNSSKAEQLSTLDDSISVSYDSFVSQKENCLHLDVAIKIFVRFDKCHEISPSEFCCSLSCDDHEYSSPCNVSEDNIPVFEVCSPEHTVACIFIKSHKYGIVGVRDKKFFCYFCRKNLCRHAQFMIRMDGTALSNYPPIVTKLFEQYQSESLSTDRKAKFRGPKVLSRKHIKFTRDVHLASLLKDQLKSAPQDLDGNLLLVPIDETCVCGANLQPGNPMENGWIAYENSVVVTNSLVLTANVYFKPCTECDAVTVFEGQNLGLVNMGTYLVAYEVLRNYMHCFLHGRRPMHTFYMSWCDLHKDYGNMDITTTFPYDKFKNAWYSFLKLLDIDFNEGFCCSLCSDNNDDAPEVIICDGTSVSFQHRMWSWQGGEEEMKTKIPQTRFIDRVCVESVGIRTLLKRYARVKNTKPLKPEEKEEMIKQLKGTFPSLCNFIMEIDDSTPSCPEVFRNFVSSMASNSPVCSYIYINKTASQLLSDICSNLNVRQDPMKWRQLHEELPLIYQVLSNTSGVTTSFKNLLSNLWDLACDPFVSSASASDQQNTAVTDDDLCFFPVLPKYRNRGVFQADKSRSSASCNKVYAGHPTLLPGIFTLYCPHGVCYGFQVMANKESPNVPFTIFRTRFKTAPKVVVYDNACALHQYCLNRDPLFFKDTEFYVDRLHWDNHIGCSIGYFLSFHPKWDHLNSQVNEQANAGLKRIKDQLSYMTAENFMSHATFYLYNKNMLKGSDKE